MIWPVKLRALNGRITGTAARRVMMSPPFGQSKCVPKSTAQSFFVLS